MKNNRCGTVFFCRSSIFVSKKKNTMLERDYVMRLVRQFLEALENLREKKETDAFEVQEELQQMYQTYIGSSEAFFRQASSEEILSQLKSYPSLELLYRAEMLAELYFYDGSMKTSVEEKRNLWGKSLSLFEYIDTYSDTFSFERRGKISKIKGLLKQ